MFNLLLVLPFKALQNGGKLFIVNLQRTPYDNVASAKIYAKTDDFMVALMKELNLTNFDTTYDHCKFLVEKEMEEEEKKKSDRIKKWVLMLSVIVCLVAVGVVAFRNM